MRRAHTTPWPKITTAGLVIAFAIFASTVESADDKIQNEPVSAAIDLIRSSIVQIRFLKFPKVDRVLGTGFLVGKNGYVITANHVLEAANKLISTRSNLPGKREFFIGVAQPNEEIIVKTTGEKRIMVANFDIYDFEIIDVDHKNDLALLKTKINIFEKNSRVGSAKLDIDRPHDGTSVAISGYPLSEPVLITNAGIIATTWAEKGLLQPGIARRTFIYLADVVANPGNSGGPVYKVSNGSVIGICVGGRTRNIHQRTHEGLRPVPLFDFAGLTVVIPIKHAVSLLEKNGIRWSEIKN